MAKFIHVDQNPLKEYGYVASDYIFFCPGCNCHHGVWTTERNGRNAIWEFNNNVDTPTVNPSILVTSGNEKGPTICHSFIREGKIEFLSDCTHELKSQTVELPDINS